MQHLSRPWLMALAAILAIGCFLRLPPALFHSGPFRALSPLHPQPMNQRVGFDEHLYAVYTNGVIQDGLGSYPDMVAQYRQHQQTLTGSILPPLRFLYIFTAAIWHAIFGGDALSSLRNVASLFGMLTLALATLFAWRLGGPPLRTVAIAALMAFAPTQLHMSQHALVDGFFTFWATLALCALWENLRAPRDWRWLGILAFALAAMVLTKENALFVWVGLGGVLLANRWFHFGSVTRELLAAFVLGPALGFVALVWLAGGLSALFATYQLSVSKNYQLTYAILTGDGPWYRYLVDLFLVSPIVMLLAIGACFHLRREQTVEWFVLIFVAASYLVMCNIKYGMNLRYANMWDLPLRLLAFSELFALSALLPRWRTAALIAAVALVCASEFRNYLTLAVKYPLYELVTPELMRAEKILKTSTP